MSKSSIWIILLVIVVIIVLAFVGGRAIYFGSSANAYTPPQRELLDIKLESAAASARLEAVDHPTTSEGVVVVDFDHRNALFAEELNILLSKLVTRGFSYEILLASGGEDDNGDAGKGGLVDKLSYADALILPLPRDEYTDEEITAIEQFVEKGGRVLIIGDPTRTVLVEALNSIAGSFGIIYANDYLYSLESNDNNYRNVVYTNFEDSPITKGLDEGNKVIFYSGNSINAPGNEIILGDDTTYSSISEGGRTMAAAALTSNDQVLALGDLTFFSEPYSAAESNGTLINNIADFLTSGERSFELKDFPYFFKANVDIVYDDPLVFNSQFEDSVKLKDFLEASERTVNLTDDIADNNDAIFVGRFDNTDAVAEYLELANITLLEQKDGSDAEELLVDDESSEADAEEKNATFVSDAPPADIDQDFVEGRIQIEGVGELEMGGSTLFALHQEDDRNVLIILSDNPDTNADAFELLLNHEFTECLASSTVAVCQTEEPDKRQPPSIRSTRIDKILVVSDDDGREREDAQTSFAEYNNVLSSTYKITIWSTDDDGPLNLEELQEYDAVIWSTGDYWDDSIDQDDTELLTKYVEAGGNLLMSGASIGFDWDHTDFLTNIAHADYLTFAEQADLELTLDDHPIARGFEEGATITFIETPSGEKLEPDVVNHTSNARVIFKRGPDSQEEGAASIIAYEDDRSKVAYFAFPVYLLPAEEQAILLENTIDWFTRKPLDLPDEKDYTPFEIDGSDDKEDVEATPSPDEETTGEGEEDTGADNGNGEEGDGNGNGNGNGNGEEGNGNEGNGAGN